MDFGRVMTAMVTPFLDNGEVDYDEVKRLAVHLIENGNDSLVVCGTTAETPTLTHEEKNQYRKGCERSHRRKSGYHRGHRHQLHQNHH